MKQIVFGTRQIGGLPSYNPCREKQAQEVLETAYKEGIRMYDTAPIYGNGKSELLLGKYLGEQRKNIEIISKFGFDMQKNGENIFNFSPDGIQKQLEGSLQRLKTNFIDIYLLHIPDNLLDVSSILSTLNSLKKQGIIKKYGLCNTYAEQLQAFLKHPLSEIEYIEDFYNIIERKAEKSIFPYLKKEISFIAYGSLYRGLLTKQSIKELLETNQSAINRLIKHSGFPFLYRQKLLFTTIATKRGISIEQVALEFLAKSPQTTHILFGTREKEHLLSLLNIWKNI